MLKTLARLIVGLVFLFSGFVKAVDPVGGAIKIGEYLEIIGIHSTAFSTLAAIILCTLEFAIGFQLFFGFKVKKTAFPAMLFMLFFTLLTLYIAIFEPVTDCGCFGDAIKMSNWATFLKNILLLPVSIFIYSKRNDYKSPLNSAKQTSGAALGLLFALGLSLYNLTHLPLLDFRPYHIGQNISEGMTTPDDAPQPEYETTFIMEKNGERREFDMESYPYNDSTWVFIDQKSILISEGYQPPIQNFILETIDGDDMTTAILGNDQPVFLAVMPKTEKASPRHIDSLKAIHEMCLQYEYPFYVLTSSLPEQYFEFDARHNAGFEYLSADETMLKTIIRANPGLVVLEKGTIIAKYSHTELPESDDLKHPLSHTLKSLQSDYKKWLMAILGLLLVSSVVILYRL